MKNVVNDISLKYFFGKLKEVFATKEDLKTAGGGSPITALTGYQVSYLMTDKYGNDCYKMFFNNGSAIVYQTKLGSIGESGGVFGVGVQVRGNNYAIGSQNLIRDPLQTNILNSARRSVKLETWETSNNQAQWYKNEVYVENPVQDASKYDWTNAKYNANDTNAVSLANQKNLMRIYYEIGAWSDRVVERFGAVKK